MNGFWAEFRHALGRLRGQIIGWGIGLFLYGLVMGLMYDTINKIEGLEEMLASYPREMMAFFGDMMNLSSPAGYFGTYYTSYIVLIVGILAITAASAMLAGDEEKGFLDLMLSYPVSRAAMFWGRYAAYAVAMILTLLLGYLGWVLTLPSSNLDIDPLTLLLAFVPVLALMLVFGAMALLASMVLPAARMASMVAGSLMFGNFLLAGLAELNDNLKPLMDITPWAFFQGGDAVNGVNWTWVLGLLGSVLLMVAAAFVLFLRRDIRVGGERSWNFRRPAHR